MLVDVSTVFWVVGVFVVALATSVLVKWFGYRLERGFTSNERVNILAVILAVLITALVFVIRFVL